MVYVNTRKHVSFDWQLHQQLLLMLDLLFYLMILTSLYNHLNASLLSICLCIYTFLINFSSLTTISMSFYHYNHVISNGYLQRLISTAYCSDGSIKTENDNWHKKFTHYHSYRSYYSSFCYLIVVLLLFSSFRQHQHQHAHVWHVTVDLMMIQSLA